MSSENPSSPSSPDVPASRSFSIPVTSSITSPRFSDGFSTSPSNEIHISPPMNGSSASPRTRVTPPPRFTLNQDSPTTFPTRTRTLQALIESPPITRRTRSNSSTGLDVEAGQRGSSEGDGTKVIAYSVDGGLRERRMSMGAAALQTPELRSMRLIGPRNSRYEW